MRFMMLMIPKGYESAGSELARMPRTWPPCQSTTTP